MQRFFILLLFLLAVVEPAIGQIPQLPQEISTRFGILSVGKDKVLLYKGQPLNPEIVGNSSLNLGSPFKIGATDVAIVRDNGGTACPYLYYFVTVTKTGATATASFGTCGEATKIQRSSMSIVVTMRGYRGPFEPLEGRQAADKERHIYIFKNGKVEKRN